MSFLLKLFIALTDVLTTQLIHKIKLYTTAGIIKGGPSLEMEILLILDRDSWKNYGVDFSVAMG